MECPKCEASLADSATYCGCGWKKDAARKGKVSAVLPYIPCARLGCGTGATVSVKMGGVLVDYCPYHYSMLFLDSANKTCEKLGLYTTEKKRAWVSQQVASMTARMRPDYLKREPGEDEDFTYLQA